MRAGVSAMRWRVLRRLVFEAFAAWTEAAFFGRRVTREEAMRRIAWQGELKLLAIAFAQWASAWLVARAVHSTRVDCAKRQAAIALQKFAGVG